MNWASSNRESAAKHAPARRLNDLKSTRCKNPPKFLWQLHHRMWHSRYEGLSIRLASRSSAAYLARGERTLLNGRQLSNSSDFSPIALLGPTGRKQRVIKAIILSSTWAMMYAYDFVVEGRELHLDMSIDSALTIGTDRIVNVRWDERSGGQSLATSI